MKGRIKRTRNEEGAALAIAIIVLAILAVVSLTALTFSASEARIAGSELRRSQTFYAAATGIEKMTDDFSNIFRKKIHPTAADLAAVEANHSPELIAEGFSFDQRLEVDTEKLDKLRAIQGIPSTFYPRVNIPEGPYAGLFASIIPYKMRSTATLGHSNESVKLEREFNNYLVPLFQFGIFSNEDIELHPGPLTTFNGRIHSNANIYALRNLKFQSRLTMAGELVRDAWRSGIPNTASGNTNVWMEVNGLSVNINKGSVENSGGTVGGPYITSAVAGGRGFNPGSPEGRANSNWESTSMLPADGSPGKFGGQINTETTGASELKLPLQLEGNSPLELIKRKLPSDSEILRDSRYENKAAIKILLDDEAAGSGAANEAGIPAGKGVLLSAFDPIPLGGGNALRRVSDAGGYLDPSSIKQECGGGTADATVVRNARAVPSAGCVDRSPAGAGLSGRILVEVVKPDGSAVDVTREILSMGMTQGEPNGIIYLQRPLWAAYLQGSRDRSNIASETTLTRFTMDTQTGADGEIIASPVFDTARGFLTGNFSSLNEDNLAGFIVRDEFQNDVAEPFNKIVPINVYNVREGWFQSSMSENNIYERGITSVVELNMKNLARWVDGVYDTNLLAGTQAVSANIGGGDGYVVYVSDRRGDQVKTERTAAGADYQSTNGNVDNEDIYGPNNMMDPGEDVIESGWDSALGAPKKNSLQKDIAELPDYGITWLPTYCAIDPRECRARSVLTHPVSYFRRAVRLFNGETLSISAAANKLSPTKGITVASENMVYIWGNYNTTGVSSIPASGSTINDGGYLGAQVPASIAADAFFPLSKTWFDALSALHPQGSGDPRGQTGDPLRMADENLPGDSHATSVRAGIIAGTTTSAITSIPGRDAGGQKISGGAINFPRFLELWNLNGTVRSWNYAGSFIPLYRSTQALSQWENNTAVIYMPPRRNWSFDITFRSPSRIPPGTPFFQYVSATGFRQKFRD